VGALGGNDGIADFDVVEFGLVPSKFVAFTTNEYETPLSKPVTMQVSVDPFGVVQVFVG